MCQFYVLHKTRASLSLCLLSSENRRSETQRILLRKEAPSILGRTFIYPEADSKGFKGHISLFRKVLSLEHRHPQREILLLSHRGVTSVPG